MERPANLPDDDPDLFAREMERLGVQGASQPDPRPPAQAAEEGRGEQVSAGEEDRDLFLNALGRMETIFHDELPEEPELPAAPRRMKQVRQGKLVPEATLDLHGFNRLQAREKIGYFLENAAWQGFGTVLVITGRGHRSGGEPVLRTELERYLREEAAQLVAEWGRAPARYGGEGAVVIFLRARRK